ncbi:MAG TPA: bifunctional phosphopantothenoylcysteine decarboxylase/phosphopantothenate--cysteine ligase CoaBC [Terriglobales bacterium]|nr:bifunctional phosphopantothenoylcysteine decarboxylase/phosphopantothenate--cysteine ligase CoaBC [Terriglobales bacterium]
MKVALGVCGGIAAYKACEIVRLLQDEGIHVQVVMTAAAQEFVRPLTFAALSGEKVITSLWQSSGEVPNLDSAIEHIGVAQSIDALVVAPCTADTLAKFARGQADDFLTTLHLATPAPVVVAPTMNVQMWRHPATQENLNILRERGVRIVEPGTGYLACGMVGEGRLAEPEEIVAATLAVLGIVRDLQGETVLVTAGPTREPVDPVRFLGNRSSGKMGYALAEAAARRGAKVILISGPVEIAPPAQCEVLRVETAEQMRNAVLARAEEASVVIAAAAVSDFRVRNAAAQKIKRNGAVTLELEPTSDILAEVASRHIRGQLLIGFAAETENAVENGRKKLRQKGLHAIVINDVSQLGIGFDSDQNEVTVLTADEQTKFPKTEKLKIAHRVLDVVAKLRAREGKAASVKV